MSYPNSTIGITTVNNLLERTDKYVIVDGMKKVMGRPTNIAGVKKVREFRKKGLSFRQIALLMKKDTRQILRWAQSTVDLSTL